MAEMTAAEERQRILSIITAETKSIRKERKWGPGDDPRVILLERLTVSILSGAK